MGLCVSRSAAPPPSTVTVATAKVVRLDGSIAQYATSATAREAVGSDAASFLCSSDELRFDVPARALAAEEALQPGWLYFALPVSMLRRPLSGQEMAALAVKASSALSVATDGKKAAQVAPLVGADEGERDGEWSHHVYGKYGPRKTGSICRGVVQRMSAILETSES